MNLLKNKKIMGTKVEKLNNKSLIFLIWKQRRILNGLARRVKTLLAEKEQSAKTYTEMHNEMHNEFWVKGGFIDNIATHRNELLQEVAMLKGELKAYQQKGVSHEN